MTTKSDEIRSGVATPDEQHLINKQNWRNYELERAHELSKLIALMIEAAMRFVFSWLKDNAELDAPERYMIDMHVEQLRAHSEAIKIWEDQHNGQDGSENTAGGSKPLSEPEDAKPTYPTKDYSAAAFAAEHPLGANHDPRDQKAVSRLLKTCEHDLEEAYFYETELREKFGFHFVDGELDSAVLPALEVILYQSEGATKEGLAVAALYTLMKRHPRAFGRYFEGNDRPWPRPSKELQAEIDSGKPAYMEHLYEELAVALEEEKDKPAKVPPAGDAQVVSGDLSSTASRTETEEPAAKAPGLGYPIRALQGGNIDESLYDDRGRRIDVEESFFDYRGPEGYLPIEADEALRERIEADLTIDPHHLESLDGLKLLLASDAEKSRVFCNSLDDTASKILNLLLEVGIREIEEPCSTVVGVIGKLILTALDIRAAESQNMLDRLIL